MEINILSFTLGSLSILLLTSFIYLFYTLYQVRRQVELHENRINNLNELINEAFRDIERNNIDLQRSFEDELTNLKSTINNIYNEINKQK
ncbi:MAG: hypothetical protein RLZZ86_2524 [Cyanobacteriota bacterium]